MKVSGLAAAVVLFGVVALNALAGGVRAAVVTVEGTLTVGGSGPVPYLQLRTGDGTLYRVTGPVQPELRRLAPGWVVRVVGRAGEGKTRPTSLEAVQYQVVTALTPAGEFKPIVGRLLGDGGEAYLVGPDLQIHRLTGPGAAGLGRATGAALCVVGKAGPSRGNIAELQVDFVQWLTSERPAPAKK